MKKIEYYEPEIPIHFPQMAPCPHCGCDVRWLERIEDAGDTWTWNDSVPCYEPDDHLVAATCVGRHETVCPNFFGQEDGPSGLPEHGSVTASMGDDAALQKQIDDFSAAWNRRAVEGAMTERIENLEDELRMLRAKMARVQWDLDWLY